MALSVTAGVSRLVGKYTLRPRQNHVQWAQHTKQGRSRAFNGHASSPGSSQNRSCSPARMKSRRAKLG
jgi:hypothetical protein